MPTRIRTPVGAEPGFGAGVLARAMGGGLQGSALSSSAPGQWVNYESFKAKDSRIFHQENSSFFLISCVFTTSCSTGLLP